MKNTDVLLKVRPDNYEDEERKRLENVKKNLDYIVTKLRLIDGLGKNEGWHLFVEDLKTEERRILRMIEITESPTQLAKLNGSLLVVKSFISYVPDTMAELDAQAKALAE